EELRVVSVTSRTNAILDTRRPEVGVVSDLSREDSPILASLEFLKRVLEITGGWADQGSDAGREIPCTPDRKAFHSVHQDAFELRVVMNVVLQKQQGSGCTFLAA